MQLVASQYKLPTLTTIKALSLVLVLSGCATSKITNNPEDINDDGENNIVLISYDVVLNVSNRYRTVKSTALDFRCQVGDNRLTPSCFKIQIPFKGLKENSEGYIQHSFSGEGILPFKTTYSDYRLQRLTHKVVVDEIPERICNRSKKTGKVNCYNTTRNESETHSFEPTPTAYFNVDRGEGCYLGHLTLHLEDSNVVSYELDQAFNDDVISRVKPELQAAVRSHVTKTCAPPAG